jgi:hypothetical protein
MPNNGKKTQVFPDSGFHQEFFARMMLAGEIYTPIAANAILAISHRYDCLLRCFERLRSSYG